MDEFGARTVSEGKKAARDGKKRVFNPTVETRLTRSDIQRLDEAAKAAGKSRSDFMRQILLWYLDNQKNIELDKRETEVAQAIRYATEQHVKAIKGGTDRICKMLARQGTAIGTLYELSWMALPDDENAKLVFEVAAKTAKAKMHRHLEKDEAEIAEKMKKVAES